MTLPAARRESFRFLWVLFSAALVAAASVVYALVLAQTWAAFSGRVFSRFAFTLCFYFCAWGLGALFVKKPSTRKAGLTMLAGMGILLLLCGVLLMGMVALVPSARSHFVFDLCVLSGVVFIGVLTGGALVLMEDFLRGRCSSFKAALVYSAGILTGTALFSGYFYPVAGVWTAVLYGGTANSAAVILLVIQGIWGDQGIQKKFLFLLLLALLLFPLVIFLLQSRG